MAKIDLRKKAPQSALTRYPNKQSTYTTGAYIEPVSYTGQDGKEVFGWIVTGFEDDTYRGGKYLNVEPCAGTLAGLTPPEENDEADENTGEVAARL